MPGPADPPWDDSLTTAAATPSPAARALPPVLGRLLRGSFWLALKTPLQAIFAFWSIPLIIESVGQDAFGAYGFAWGFGFIQFLLEFGMSSALQRQVSDCWTRDDREGVNRAIACGTAFYAAVAAIQIVALLAIAAWAVPFAGYAGDSARLVVKLLLLQALVAPAYGFSTVIASVLQAARRYDFFPRLEVAAVILRFAILYAGLSAGFDFFGIVAAQVATQVALMLGPASWVMVRELGFRLHVRGARWGEFRGLMKVSVYVFLIQLSVVLADRIDKTVLGFALPAGVAGPATAVYEVVSKPFFQIRQTGWMLSYLVMPAVASLAAAGDRRGLERVKYDGSRLLIGLLTPVALLACIDAAPFLSLWVGPSYADAAPLLRLFLVASLPLIISVLVQTSIGLGKLDVIALAALGGSLVNLPLS
jgi:O-antigen/teichoic acid export membrane protein